jgi:polysaccharide export outer membrane protein
MKQTNLTQQAGFSERTAARRLLVGVACIGLMTTPLIAGAQSTAPAAPRQIPPVPVNVGADATAPVPIGGSTLSLPLETLAGLTSDYRIGANDLLDIEVYGVPDLKRQVRVNSSGIVSLALVGNVSVAGLSGAQAEAKIATMYEEKYLQNPQVSIFIREYSTKRITVEGAVTRPGIYPVTGPLTLLRVLALAGGGAQFADLSEIMVFRRTSSESLPDSLVYNLETIRDGSVEDPVIQADDVIVVKRSAARTALRDSLFRDIIDSINPFSSLGGN